ncbi:MAG: porin, partial [Flavobacterium sp.]|nr:porin [Flavobacterium sp.]
GQLGDDLFDKRDLQSVLLDAMVKYDGWALMTSYMNRTAKDPITFNPENDLEFKYIFVGEGLDYQLSYLFLNNIEVIGRFSTQKVHETIKPFTPDTKQYSLGVTKYFWEHAFKIQSELSFDELSFANGSTRNNWYLRFQVEIGI